MRSNILSFFVKTKSFKKIKFNRHQKGHILGFIFFALIISCNKNDENRSGNDSGQLSYSESPIDLNGTDALFVENHPYDAKARTVFDIWMPVSSPPTALVVYFHGGGFTSGDKTIVQTLPSTANETFADDIVQLLNNNIAVASVNYSYLDQTGEEIGIFKCLNDVKRSIQFLRYNSELFNIDQERIMLVGNSSGAGAALWIATKDDLSEVNFNDPVQSMSSRVSGAILFETQSTYDVERWFTDVFEEYSISLETFKNDEEVIPKVLQLYALEEIDEFFDNSTIIYRDQVDMLDQISPDDPPLFIQNINQPKEQPMDLNLLNHHPNHAMILREYANEAGLDNVCYYGKQSSLYSDPSGENWVEFAMRLLK
jgi:para-nitrobenzyl esterase